MWFKTDDQMPDHPKILAAGIKGGWLYVCGLAYASRMLTDGFIPLAQVRRLADMRGAMRVAETLVRVGLWEPCEGGFRIHDYLKYQASREEVEAKRETDRGRKSPTIIRRESAWNPTGIRADSTRSDTDAESEEISTTTAAATPAIAHLDLSPTPSAPEPVMVPQCAASTSAIAQRAHLAPHDEHDLAKVVEKHLSLWPEDVLVEQAERFDRWAKDTGAARTVNAIDSFFTRIRVEPTSSHASSTHPARASPEPDMLDIPADADADIAARMAGAQLFLRATKPKPKGRHP